MEAASLLESISATKDNRKMPIGTSDIKESSEETNDKSKNNTTANEDRFRTSELPNRKNTRTGRFMTEEEKQSPVLDGETQLIASMNNEIKERQQSIRNKDDITSSEKEKGIRSFIESERKNSDESKRKPNEEAICLLKTQEKDESKKNMDSPLEKGIKEENNLAKAQNLLNPQPVVQPKIIDRAGAKLRKEEFEKRMKEKNTNENKLQSLKQKFQAASPIKEQLNEVLPENKILTPKEPNIPQEKGLDLELMDQILKKKLDDLQKKEEKPADQEIKEKSIMEAKDKPISLQDYRNQMKNKKTLNETKEEKYIVNDRGQRINKNLVGLIDQLEKTLGGKPNTKEDEPRNNLEHITMERGKMGHKKMKSKNSNFFDLI